MACEDHDPDLFYMSPKIFHEDRPHSEMIKEDRDRKWHTAVARAQDRHRQRTHPIFVQCLGYSLD
jgi:hypothetical protein